MKDRWHLPYPSKRSPVFANNLVASSQPLAVQAGIQAIKDGGNAVDAALATAITLTVVEPCNNGIGSDAFAIVWDGKKLHGLNASGKSPSAWTPEKFAKLEKMPALGWDTVTVPGAVSAWLALSDKFGRLPFERLFEAAIQYAEDGYQVGLETSGIWKRAEHIYRDFDEFSKVFLPSGSAPAPGEIVRLPDHAKTLKAIASTRGEAFYNGELAEAMVKDAKRLRGDLSMDDLANHEAFWVDPLSLTYQSHHRDAVKLHEIPPSGQGIMALIAAGILNHLDVSSFPVDSPDSMHLQIEAMRSAYAEIKRHLADSNFMQVRTGDLLDPAYLEKKARAIRLNKADSAPFTLPTNDDTVYLSTADSQGMMVSMIQSNFRGFGSGIVIPGTGISMQNRGSGFTLEAGHPNEVTGNKRPYHTIIPGFVTREDKPLLSFGVMGGHMQAQGHLQMLLRLFDYNQNPQAALDAPRWQVMETGEIALEAGINPETATELARRGHRITRTNHYSLFGGGQIIERLSEGYAGGSDHRKEGLVAGF